MTQNSAIYEGAVVHTRTAPVRHRFRYRVFCLLIDLDELNTLDSNHRLFGVNRWRPLSFVESDHGDGQGNLKSWVIGQLRRIGLNHNIGRVTLLCYPRLWGYVFNPLSVYFCYNQDNQLIATVHEVNNTFGERIAYVLPATRTSETPNRVVTQDCAKAMYVSPFMDMDMHYHFRLRPPGKDVSIGIRETRGGPDGDAMFFAAFQGTRQEISSASLAGLLIRYPLMTVKVMAAIHLEAFHLWRKKVGLRKRTPAPSLSLSNVTDNKAVT